MKKHLPFLLVALAALALDQISKYIVAAQIALGEQIEVIPGFFSLTYVRNTGAAWSLFAGNDMLFFYLATAVALVVLFLFYRHSGREDFGTRMGLALMMSGALGNLIDRVCFHYVRDFLDFNLLGYDFPVFNIADSALCIGVFLLFVVIWKEEFGVRKR